LRRGLAITPTYTGGHSLLGILLLEEERLEDARVEFQLEGQEGDQGGLAMVYHALGRKADSAAALERYIRENADDSAFGLAETYAYLGEADRAFEWLERACQRKDPALIYAKGDWPLRGIEQDPRYKAFLKKMNLPE
jgi:tetratricopeptide (TPR) repeat protein